MRIAMNKKLFMVATLFCLNFAFLMQALSTPVISRSYGDPFADEVGLTQSLGEVGTLDDTFDTDGSLDLSSITSGSQALAAQVLSDGTFVVLLNEGGGSDSKLVKYTETGILDLTFGSGTGIIASTGLTATNGSIVVDEQGRFLVRGLNGVTTAWIQRITSVGAVDSSFTFTDGAAWSNFLNSIMLQSSGKIIAAGYNGTNALMTRYNLDGSIDTTFGVAGTGRVIFDGSNDINTNAFPTGFVIRNVIVDVSDNIYVLCGFSNNVDSFITKITVDGALDTAFNGTGTVAVSYLDGSDYYSPANKSSAFMTFDLNGNLIVGAAVSNIIKITGFTSAGGAIGGFSNFSSNPTVSANNFKLYDILTTTDGTNGKIFAIGSDTTSKKSSVIRLTNTGALDTDFNTTGYNEFLTGTASSVIYGSAIAPDGKLYTAGALNSGADVPYVSRLNNDPYVSQVAQFPAETAQGDIDLTFGTAATETYTGVTLPFNGLYGSSLQQTTNSVIELSDTTILVGMSGKLDDSNNSNMMVTNLNADGSVNTQVNLDKTYTDEYLTSMIEDSSGNLLVVGHDGDGTNATLRKYPTGGSTGTETWAVTDTTGTASENFGVAIQSTERILVFGQTTTTAGMISAYLPGGTLDTTGFNSASGSVPGKISGADYAGTPLANMGPIYAYAVNDQDNIYIAYKNQSTNKIDVALIYQDGRGLITEFNPNGTTPGIVADVFGVTIANANDVRIALNNEANLVVAAAVGGTYLLKELFSIEAFVDSTYDSDFASAGTLTVNAGTAVVINQLTALSDNTVLITGYDNATDDSMLVIRVTSAGALDTAFNSQGTTPGILPLQIGNIVTNYDSRSATGLVVQAASGNMIVTGYEKQTSTLSVPMVMRLYGKSGTTQVKQSPIENPNIPGTLDVTFDSQFDANGDGSIDLSSVDAGLVGATKTFYAYRTGSTKQGYSLVGVDTGTDTKIARIRQNDNTLDSSFGDASSGIITLSGVIGLNHLSLDSLDRILIAGTQSGAGWIQRLTTAGVADVAFTALGTLVEANAVGQQESGRYLVAGKDTSGNGVLVAFQDKLVGVSTTLAVDTTFNPLGQVNGTAAATVAGWFTSSATSSGLYNVTINGDDTILIAYQDTNVQLQKITANGSGRTASFNSGAVLGTTIVPSSPSAIRTVIDENGKIIVASAVSGNTVSTVRYSSAGGVDGSFNTDGSVYTITTSLLGSAGVTLTNLAVTNESTTDGKILLTGYNTAGGNGKLFAVRLGTNGVLDSTWNTSPSGSDIPGLTTFTVNGEDVGVAASAMYDSNIFINGDIYGAVAAVGTSDKALLVRLFGDNYITQVEEQPFEVLPGLIDTTLDFITPDSGALNLNSAPYSLALTGYTSKKMYVYASGEILLGLSNGTNTKIVRLQADRSVDTSGFGTSGVATVTTIKNLNDMFVADGANDDGSIYLTGNNGSAVMVTEKLDSSGVDQTFTAPNTTPAMTVGWAVRQTTNSRILVAGFDGSNGMIAAYNNDGSAIDVSFANGAGKFSIGTSVLYDMALDTDDRIYVAYRNGSNIDVKRIDANGTAVDSVFVATSITPTTALSSSQIRLSIDDTNDHVVVAVQDGTGAGNLLKVRRFNILDGSAAGSIDTVSIPGKVLNLVDLFIDDAKNIYVTASNITDNYGVVAKIQDVNTTTISLDTDYNAAGAVPGIANVNTGVTSYVVSASILHPDRRVYLMGDSSTPSPYLSRIFGDAYVTQYDESLIKAIPGTIDLTLDPDDTTQDGGIDVSLLPDWSGLSGYTAKSVYANTSGNTFIAFGDGSNWILGKADSDMNPATFGTNGLAATVATISSVNSLAVDAQGRILVAGMNTGTTAQVVYRYAADGSSSVTFASTLSLIAANRVVEQKSGRILVAGKQAFSTTGGGTILAYKNTGLVIDDTYGPQSSDGFYAIDIDQPIDDIVLDQYDDAYIVYRDTTVKIQKITANGSGLDATFATGAIVDTTIVATAAAHVSINNAGNILVAASSATSIKTALYNGSTGAIIGSLLDLSASNSNTPIATDITAADDNFVISAYETTNSGAQQMLAIRITSAGILDVTFGTGTIGAQSGIAQDNPETATVMNALTIQPDGKITMVGNNATRPIVMRFYGNPYESEYAQYPTTAAAGTLDLTLSPTTGDLDLQALIYGLDNSIDLTGFVAKRMYEDGAGKMLIAFDNGTNTILVRLYKDLTLDTTLNTTGALTIAGSTTVRGLSVDSEGNIYVSGGDAPSWMQAYNDNGSALTGFTTPTSTLSVLGSEIVLQTLDRIVLAGQDATGGVLYGYQSTTGALDPEFGNGTTGIYKTNVATPIADAAIGTLDKMYIVYNNGSGTSVLERISTNGALVDTAFATPTGFTGVTGNELRVLVKNSTDHVIVAAATTTGFTLQTYLTTNGTTLDGPLVITAGGSSTSHIANIYVTSDNKIVLTGYETTGSNIVVARLNENLTLDTTFNPSGGTPGVLTTTVGLMTTAYDATIHADDRVMIVGGNAAANLPYMARVYGDDYVTVEAQDPILGDTGTLDTTFNLGSAYIDLDTLGAGAFNDTCATAVLPLIDGTQFITFDDGSSASKLIKLTQDATSVPALDTTYNASLGFNENDTPGYLIDVNAYEHKAVTIQTDDKIVAAGIISGDVYVARYTTAGILDTTFGSGNGYILDTNGYGAESITMQTDGKIVIAGKVISSGSKGYIARYLSDGTLDTTFNGTGYIVDLNAYNLNGVAMQTDGKVVVAGNDVSNTNSYVARYLSNGLADTTANSGSGFNQSVTPGYIIDTIGEDNRAVAMQSDGKIVTAGQSAAGSPKFYVARYLSNGLTDTTANSGSGFNQSDTPGYIIQANGSVALGLAIKTDGKIVVSGTAGTNSYIAQFTTAGLLDTSSFASGNGYYLDSRSDLLWGVAIQSDGKIVFTGQDSSSYLMRLTAAGILDTTFAEGLGYLNISTARYGYGIAVQSDDAIVFVGQSPPYLGNYRAYVAKYTVDGVLDASIGTGIAADAPQGAYAILQDALSNLVITGTDGSGNGWLKRYASTGFVDTAFGTSGLVSGLDGAATVALEQSMARIVVAGKGVTNGAIRAYEPDGTVDTLFGASLNGVYDTGVATGVYTMVADVYDRLIIAYKNGSNVDLVRLTSNGELDITFGDVSGSYNTGVLSSALTSIAADETSIRVSLDSTGRIILTGLNAGSTGVQVAAFDNGTAANNNGAVIGGYTPATPITGLTGVVITGFVAIENAKMLVGGYQSTTNTMWVARLTSTGTLDTTFNSTSGILNYSFDGGATARRSNAMAIFEDGRISAVGYETNTTDNPFVTRVYNDPYQEEIAEWLTGQPIGANDLTFGLTGDNIATFFVTPAGTSAELQKARSVGIENSNRFVVVADGHSDSDATSHLFINKFNMDGILDTTFATDGQAELTQNYDQEYVKDVVVYSTGGVNKAILAGYGQNTTLSVDNSLLISYNLDTAVFDTTFGGFDQDPVGQSFADIKSHQVVGMQSSSRIVTGGVNYDSAGMILGYTQHGKLDKTFGADGYYFTSSADGIFTHAIDTSDRVVFAYVNGSNVVVLARLLADGSALDTSFNTVGSVTTTITTVDVSSEVRVAVDNNGKVVVAGFNNTAQLLTIERYNDDGTIETSAIGTDDDVIYGFTDGTITKLIVDEDNKIIVVGTDVVGGVANIFVFRILADMSGFDTTFNTTGYIIYGNTNNQAPTDAIMHPDGRVVIVGSED